MDLSMLENRLRKNRDRLEPWARREQTTAYRLYDRDIPEWPWLVDRYGDQVVVSAYVTGRDRTAEQQAVVVAAVRRVWELPEQAVVLKTRERHRSLDRQAAGSVSHEFTVQEHGLNLRVNLDDYLDTGLFLDHRAARRRVGRASKGLRVLNLFCYTGAFSVHAASGGAASTTSVDLSATYLDWAGRNLAANGLAGPAHRLVRSDVFAFLEGDTSTYDLIVLDPPTLSRASSGRSFDLQEAWPRLWQLSLARMAPDGWMLFSTNYRGFQLEASRVPPCRWRETTSQTTPIDFRHGLHRSFEVRHMKESAR